MTPENPTIPEWAQRERQADFAWIQENLDLFWTTATASLEDAGRGAIVASTYRVGAVLPELQEAVASEVIPGHTLQPYPLVRV